MYLWKPIGGRTPSRTPSNQYPADDLDGNGAWWSILPRRVRKTTSALGLSKFACQFFRVILQAEPMFSWQPHDTKTARCFDWSIGRCDCLDFPLHGPYESLVELRVDDFPHWVYLLGVTTEMQHASCTTYPNPKRTDFAPFTHGWLENYDFTWGRHMCWCIKYKCNTRQLLAIFLLRGTSMGSLHALLS